MAGGTAVLRQLVRFVPEGVLRPFGRPVAVLFHGVARMIDDPRIQLNHHARDDFYRIAKALKAGFQVLPLSALEDARKNPERHARSVFLTSDDGYRNTLTDAADILDGLGLPWTLFVSTHHIDTGELNPLTAARLFFFYAPAGRHAIPHLGAPVVLDSHRDAAAARGLKRLYALDGARGAEAVAAMMAAIPTAERQALLERFSSERFLNWPQVAQLAARGVEIGAHAHWHWPMIRAGSPSDVRREAGLAKARIEAQIGACRAFAYPFGNTRDVSREAWQAVRDAGYAYGFTTLAGTLDAGSNPWLLPRYGLRPQEPQLQRLVPTLRAGNSRLTGWQKTLA